jgi:dihydrofolate reductase
MITSLIVAASSNEVIGAAGGLPWRLPEDLRRFQRLTNGHAVVVGRLTHESIVDRLGRPLPGRTSIVLSSRTPGEVAAGTRWVTSLDSAMAEARAAESEAATDGPEIFVIGGTTVYQQALPQVDRIYLTRVHREVAGDTSMPASWLDGFRLTGQEDRPAQGTEAAYSWLDYLREPA